MISADEIQHGQASLREWDSLFSGKLFAMIAVYADESGTGGINKKNGKEPAPTICGYLATPQNWDKFRLDWSAGLKSCDAEYFHFRELDPNERKKGKAKFNSWSDSRVDDFIYKMAMIAGSGPIPCGGNVSVKREYGNNPTKENLRERYESAFEGFFYDFGLQMDRFFPRENAPVTFFFDENENEEWIAILNKVIKKCRKKDKRIAEWVAIDDRTERGIPCQAADLFVYVNRQNNETIYERDMYVPQRILDIIVGRQGFPEFHPFSALKKMSDSDWVNLIAELRGRKKAFDLQHELARTNPKPQFYPIAGHPYFNYLSQLCYEHKRAHPKLWV